MIPSLWRNTMYYYEWPKASNFIKKETLAQAFSCEFCKISKNTFSHRTTPMAASLYTFYFDV